MLNIADSQEPTIIGLAVCVLGTPEAVSFVRKCGYDFLLVDMEHGRIGIDSLSNICIAGQLADFPVYARVTGPASPDIARVLDCGATGVIIPHVDNVGQARSIVARTRFPPLGERALPGPLAAFGFEPVDVATMIATSERRTKIIAMIESCEGVAAATDIAATDGIDGLLIGSNDLAASLGHAGDIGHPDVLKAFQTVAGCALANAKQFGTMGLPEALVGSYSTALGATMIVATNEINLLYNGGVETLAKYRQYVKA